MVSPSPLSREVSRQRVWLVRSAVADLCRFSETHSFDLGMWFGIPSTYLREKYVFSL